MGSFKTGVSAENLLKASITAEQLLVDVIAVVVVWKSDTDGFDLPIFLENFELLTSKSKIWWLELHPHLLPTTPADIRVLASLLSQLDAEGVLFDNDGHFVGAAKGKNLKLS